MPNLTINYSINGPFLELVASAPILPGMLLRRTGKDYVTPHSSVDGIASPLIAVEDKLAGKLITDTYAIGAMVHCRYCLPGDVFMGLVSGIVEVGAYVSSDGAGKLKEIPAGILSDNTIVGQALAMAGTEEAYSYFAINSTFIEQVYAQTSGAYYAVDSFEQFANFAPIEVL